MTTIEDEEDEEAETFAVDLSGATNATISDSSGTGTITDPGETIGNTVPEISITDASASEGETLRFHVTLDQASTSTVTVDWATAGRLLQQKMWIMIGASGRLSPSAPDDTLKTIEVTTLQDEAE